MILPLRPDDFTANSLTGQTISAGNSSYSFSVLVNGDIVNEADETFFVNVTNVIGAAVVDAQGDGTILNDDVADAAPTVASTFPVNGATNFPVGSNLTVTFSEPVNVSVLVHIGLFHKRHSCHHVQRWTNHLYP